MKQKVAVNELRIGMHVSDLDRPWSEAPFEPPFDLQGFTIHNDSEIEKVRALCQHVYVKVPEADTQAPQGQAARRTVVETTGDLRNVRYARQTTHQKSGVRNEHQYPEDVETETDEGRGLIGRLFGRKKLKYLRVQRREAPAAEPPAAVGQPLVIPTYQYTTALESAGGPGHKATPPPEVVKIYRGQDNGGNGYVDQTTVEEELVLARDILADTEKTYLKIMKAVEDGEPADPEAVHHVVRGLVESVVRNPDALAWLLKLRKRDESSYSHSMAVCVLALTLGRHLDLPERDMKWIGIGTLLQDIGKAHIPRAILTKTDELTREERQIVRHHVDDSLKLLGGRDEYDAEVIDIIKSHHERFDGSGYPMGLEGSSINIYSSIAGLTDTYEALTSDRPYRGGMNSLDALSRIYESSDKLFASGMVEHFIQCVGIFPIGSFVLMNSGHVGVVVSRNRVQQLKPKVLMLLDPDHNKLDPPQTYDLARISSGDDQTPWKIVRVVEPEEHGLDSKFFFG